MNLMLLVAVTEVALVITGGGREIKTSVAVLVPLALTALRVTLKVPERAVDPLITPVVLLKDRPEGRPVAPKLVGLLRAVT